MSFDKIFKYTITLIATFSMTIAIISQYYSILSNKSKVKESSYNLKELNDEIKDIRNIQQELQEKYSSIMKYNPQINDSSFVINFQNTFLELSKRIDRLDEKTIGLRQAINPLKPDEILTIARLKDAIDLLDKKQLKLESDIEKKLDDFRSSVIMELYSTSKATNWLFVVLIPLVLNLLYTMWKDRREIKIKPQESSNSS